MARASSVISVSIIGDAKKLVGATKQADMATGGLVKSAAKLAITGIAISKGFDFLQTSTKEADRLGDAITRLNLQIGKADTDRLQEQASAFHDIGASRQDILELAANFADLGTTIGLTDGQIADSAVKIGAIAHAASLLEDVDPATIIEQIGKAANGSERAALALGVTLIKGASAADQLKNIMEQLEPKLTAVTSGTKDLEQQQRTLDATLEEFSALAGGPVSDALAQVVGFINDEIKAIPGAVAGWQMLGHQIDVFGREALGPLAAVAQSLENILNLLGLVNHAPRSGQTLSKNTGTDRSISDAQRRQQERNGLGT